MNVAPVHLNLLGALVDTNPISVTIVAALAAWARSSATW